jgi:hypothetical protein
MFIEGLRTKTNDVRLAGLRVEIRIALLQIYVPIITTTSTARLFVLLARETGNGNINLWRLYELHDVQTKWPFNKTL